MEGRAEDEAKFIARAAKAWKEIRRGRHWDDWMLIAAALEIGRRTALIKSGANDTSSKRYKNLFGEWCKLYGFDTMDGPTRSDLLFLVEPEHRVEVDKLRGAMAEKERIRVNHPRAMRLRLSRHLDDMHGKVKVTATIKPQRDERDARIAELEERLAGEDIEPAEIARHWWTTAGDHALARELAKRPDLDALFTMAKQMQSDARAFEP